MPTCADVRWRSLITRAALPVTDTDRSRHTRGRHRAGKRRDRAGGSRGAGQFSLGTGRGAWSAFVTQNALDSNVYPRPTFATLARIRRGTAPQVMNNSWGGDQDGGDGYDAQCREVDLAVRDPNATTPALESLAVVFSAGNTGGRPRSIPTPHECKNAIVVGNSLTSRPGQGFPSDDIRGIAGTSSRGPAVDGRILPTIVAPGTDVPSAFSRTATALHADSWHRHARSG